MKALPIALLLLSTVVTTATLAQAGDGQTSAVEETQEAAKAQAVASSFEGLQPILKVGQEVIVQDEAGQATQGKVVSISNNQLVITRLQDWRLEELAFSEDFVRRIDVADSVWWPGAVVGAAVAAGIPFLAGPSGCPPHPHGVATMATMLCS